MSSTHAVPIPGTSYEYAETTAEALRQQRMKIASMRTLVGALSAQASENLREYFRLKQIYNSNAIEGNSLSLGETQLVIRDGLTISGKPLKDTVEAKNLSHALTYFEELVRSTQPLREVDVRQIHALILKDIDTINAGRYRTVEVRISRSAYATPSPEQVLTLMHEFGDWLQTVSLSPPQFEHTPLEIVPLACAVHTWFVYIHPFVDGNGRTARLLMNLMLMRNGYPVAIIQQSEKERCYEALEESQAGDLTPFIQLVYESIEESWTYYEQAAHDQLDLESWAAALTAGSDARLRLEYDVFESAMKLFKGIFRQIIEVVSERRGEQFRLHYRDFGFLDLEKYHNLKNGQTAKRTWFFGIDIYPGGQRQRYIFWFGFSDNALMTALDKRDVTLHVSFETTPAYYRRIRSLYDEHQPDIVEIGYLAHEETFVCSTAGGRVEKARAEEIATRFIEQLLERRF